MQSNKQSASAGCGSLQYVVSPSLPRQVQKPIQETRMNDTLTGSRSRSMPIKPRASPASVVRNGGSAAYQAYPALPKLYGTLHGLPEQGVDGAGFADRGASLVSAGEPVAALEDTLSRIGPSARRLLGMMPEDAEAASLKSASHAKRARVAPLAATAPAPLSSSAKTGSVPRPARPAFASTATLGYANTFSPREVAKAAPLFSSTLSRDPQEEPPLVVTLREYLDRELRLARDGTLTASGADQLGPYREAFAALITAFPGYSALLSDIRSAYDNVIQCQAELLTEAYGRESTASLRRRETTDNTQDLSAQVHALQNELESMRAELQQRDAVAAEAAERGLSSAAATRPRSANATVLQRQLEQSETRVQELERQSRSDMEKILVLIAAVRDCDKRLHDYEVEVQLMAGQVSELDEFKRLTAEAQAELVQYQQKFQAFVPSNDFTMMKDYLTEELATAQTTIRKLRRTAAVRGTQVDVMTRKLEQLQSEHNQLLGDAAGASNLLTPRPNWAAITAELPELGEYTKAVHTAPLTAATGASDALPDNDVQILAVPGPSRSKAQVEYLVQRLVALEKTLAQVSAEKTALEEAARRTDANEEAVPDAIGQGRPTTARLQHGQARRSQSGLDMSATAAKAAVRPAYPILAAGLGVRVPSYARAVGTVERVVMPQTVCTRLLYDFFTQVLEPTMDVGVDADAISPGELFVRFLSEEMPRNEDLNSRFDNVSHVVLNLLEDATKPTLTSPPLDILARILRGSVPPRVAVDSSSVVKLAIADLQALAREQQSKRLRRSAITECLFPVLELKTQPELAELRGCLGSELTFDVSVLTALENRFMTTLFFQESRANLQFYASLVDSLTKASERVTGLNEAERCLHLSSVAEVIFRCEPLTPQVVLRELSENAVHKDVPEDDEDDDAAARGVQDGEPQALPEDVPIRLSELLHAVASAPLIRRTRHAAKEECSL